MLAIRLKRIGRANLAQYRVIVQDSHRHPKRGAVVEYVGTYDPHAKTAELDKDSIQQYLKNGAQPSNSVARLLKKEGVKLPKWVAISKEPKRAIRNPEKLRRNRPAGSEAPAKPEEVKAEEPAPAEEPKAEEAKTEDKPEAEAKPESAAAEEPVATEPVAAPAEETPAEATPDKK